MLVLDYSNEQENTLALSSSSDSLAPAGPAHQPSPATRHLQAPAPALPFVPWAPVHLRRGREKTSRWAPACHPRSPVRVGPTSPLFCLRLPLAVAGSRPDLTWAQFLPIAKFFKILRHIESLDACMKY